MKKLFLWPMVLGSTIALLLCYGLGAKHLDWPIVFWIFTILFWIAHELYKKFSKRQCPLCEGSGKIYQLDRKIECYLCHGTGKF